MDFFYVALNMLLNFKRVFLDVFEVAVVQNVNNLIDLKFDVHI